MTRSVLAILFVAGLFFACLPEISALKGPVEDAGAEAADIAPPAACGDGFIDDDAGEKCDPGQTLTTSCSDCKQFACPGAIDTQTGHCYYVAAAASSLQDARVACAGAHVVTIDSDREAAFVDALTSSPYWVGASYTSILRGYGAEVPTEPGFTIEGGCTGCYVRGVTSSDAGSDCVVSTDGGWSLTSCSGITATTICEREPPGHRSEFCGGSYCSVIPITLGSKRYIFYLPSFGRSAQSAAEECVRRGGRLVLLDSREERRQLVQELLRLGVDTPIDAWIGISKDGGSWVWDDGLVVEDGGRPSPWGAGQPNANADAGRAFIRIGPFFDSQLAQTGDDIPRPFICERK